MKSTPIHLAAIAAFASAGSASAATVIFSDDFTTAGTSRGGSYVSSIVGATTTTGGGTWLDATIEVGGWGQAGDGRATPTSSNFLSFSPIASLSYTVQATIDTINSGSTSDSWFTLGFTSSLHHWNGTDSSTIDTANLVRFKDKKSSTISYTLSGATLVANSIQYVGWITDLPGAMNLDPNNEQVKITNFSLTAVPEPSSSAMAGLAGLGLLLRRRRA